MTHNMANIVVSIYDNRDSQVTYIFYCIILVYKLSPLNYNFFLQIYRKEKKIYQQRGGGGASSNRCKAEQVL